MQSSQLLPTPAFMHLLPSGQVNAIQSGKLVQPHAIDSSAQQATIVECSRWLGMLEQTFSFYEEAALLARRFSCGFQHIEGAELKLDYF